MDMEINFPGSKKVNAIFENFIVKTDQSKFEGGEDSAPSPFSLFIASIGTCTGFYVLSFCQKRNIPTKNIKLILKTERNKETDMVNTIGIEILVPKDFPDEYKTAVIKAAEACTVKKHLEKPPKIAITVTKG